MVEADQSPPDAGTKPHIAKVGRRHDETDRFCSLESAGATSRQNQANFESASGREGRDWQESVHSICDNLDRCHTSYTGNLAER